MPRIHVRNPNARAYKAYDEDRMKLAISDVRVGNLSIKKASERYGINRTTLFNHIKNFKCKKVGRPTVLSFAEEELLAHSLIKLADWGFGLDRNHLRQCVKEFLLRTDRPNPFCDGVPGVEWCKLFEKRWKEKIS